MHLHFPNSAFLGNIDPFLRSLDLKNPALLRITANKRWISLHPVVLAMAAALGLHTMTRCEHFEATSSHYLERMRLFDFLKTQSGMRITEHEPAGRFIPLIQVRANDELQRFITEMIPLLHLAPQHADSLKYVVSELIRNVLEHADTPDGAIVCAQYYKKSNTIRIGIVDTGVGIRATIRNAHPAEDDLAALRLALTPGITGTTRREGGTTYNAGAGLFFIKSLATINKSHFLIYSGDAAYKLLKSTARRLHADPFRDRHRTLTNLPSWRGTVVGIDLNLDETAAFTELLDKIRKTYTESMRERKRAKKPRFI